MNYEPEQRVIYYQTTRFELVPVGAVVVRADDRPGWIVIRKDTFRNPICVRTTSIKPAPSAT